MLLTLLSLRSYAEGGIIEVCSTCPIQSIKTAIEQADEGDEIRIHSGTYREGTIVVNKSLVLTGLDYPILDGEGAYEILTVTAANVTIQGLHLHNTGNSYLEDRAALRIKRQKNFTIRNNRLTNTFFGIYLEKAGNGIVEGNQIIGLAENEMSSGNAIHAWHCRKIAVKNNLVIGHRDGIYFEFVDSSQVIDNRSERNLRYGLHFMFSNYDSYSCNEFWDNGAGVAVMFSKFIEMTENLFIQNWGRSSYGLLLKEIYDATILDNQFLENTIGINIEGSTRINYLGNRFVRNGWAVKMAGGCLNNNFHQNNFIANTLDLVVSSKINNNSFDGNYWSEYSGYDLNYDGIGDVPYRPVKLFAYILDQTPESIVLLRSLFIDLLNFSEKVSPVFTPADVLDHQPKIDILP
ncbi:MAG: hypothetical protein DHS20C18_45840 [Saprospiraceae bacterium]|nr:MAG: hypothetical protein DHS20C18_45840 [Saprospiraceae bacterium]